MIIFEIIEFWCHGGQDIAMGRIASGDLHLGTVFTGLFKDDPRLTNSKQPDIQLNLRLVRLLAYEKEWENLPKGYGAGIILEGEGYELLEEGCFLVA